MASEMDWSHDFCLFCDRQISGGAYCSQACRVGDLEKAGTPAPVSPLSHSNSSARSSWSATPAAAPSTGFYLPPAVNFAAYKSSSRPDSTPSSPRHSQSHQNPYFQHHSSSQTASSTKQGLSPSSSRASLSSMNSSAQNAQTLSDQAASQLRGYSDCFDQVREMRRRVTMA